MKKTVKQLIEEAKQAYEAHKRLLEKLSPKQRQELERRLKAMKDNKTETKH